MTDAIPELKIEIPKSYMESLGISASDCLFKILCSEIVNLSARTTYYPILLVNTKFNSFTGVTKNGPTAASIIGKPTDFTVKPKAANGNNNLEGHAFTGQNQLVLETKDGDIEVTFVKDQTNN